jgi:GrpB-like predicted nucleotidyltransferase (UPF0157 family)
MSSEDEMRAARIGGLETHDAPIELAPYDPAWPSLYAGEELRIRRALGDRARQIEHIGSTSVVDLAAKPVIDVLLVVDDSRDEAAYVPPLEQTGYVLRIREPAWHEHRMLRSQAPLANVHVFTIGCAEIDRLLRFRDRLRAHPDERMLYETTKRELASRIWKYKQQYADAKAPVVEAILARAAPR